MATAKGECKAWSHRPLIESMRLSACSADDDMLQTGVIAPSGATPSPLGAAPLGGKPGPATTGPEMAMMPGALLSTNACAAAPRLAGAAADGGGGGGSMLPAAVSCQCLESIWFRYPSSGARS
jgi:hypothetical protein